MSSINLHFTFEYSQPDEYRFSHDSVFLARRVFEFYKEHDIENLTGLDLCSGCGIIGLDFLFHCQKEIGKLPRSFDFMEVQDVYEPHFQRNLREAQLGPISTQFINQNYADSLKSPGEKYDLIVCNPPYFFAGQGKLSPSEFKNRCRFYLDSDFKTLLQSIEHLLTQGGSAFVLLRDLSEHGWNSFAEAKKVLSPSMTVVSLPDIRGTGLIQISKPTTVDSQGSAL